MTVGSIARSPEVLIRISVPACVSGCLCEWLLVCLFALLYIHILNTFQVFETGKKKSSMIDR